MMLFACAAASPSIMVGPLSMSGCWNFHSRQGAPATRAGVRPGFEGVWRGVACG